MARRRVPSVVFGLIGVEENSRPIGSLRFADPSTAELPRHIHTFNEPHSPNSVGEQNGVRSMTGDLVPWPDRHTTDLWAAMNRKRGVTDDGDGHG
jgi:hypothetical protein